MGYGFSQISDLRAPDFGGGIDTAANKRVELLAAQQALENQRYEQNKAQIQADKINALKAQAYGANLKPIQFDSTEAITELVDTKEQMDMFDNDKLNAALAKNKNFFENPNPEINLKHKIVNLKNKQAAEAVERITLDPTIIDKDKATREWMVANGYQDVIDEEDGTFKKGLKLIGKYGNLVRKGVNETVEAGAGLFSPELEKKLEKEDEAKMKKYDKFTEFDNPVDFIKEKAATYAKTLKTNKDVDAFNKGIKTREIERIDKLMEQFKTGKKEFVKKESKSFAPIDEQEVMLDISTKAESLAKVVENDSSLSEENKLRRIVEIGKLKQQAINSYEKDKKKNLDWKTKVREKALERDMKIQVKEAESALRMAEKNDNGSEASKMEIKQAKANYEKTLAETEYIKYKK